MKRLFIVMSAMLLTVTSAKAEVKGFEWTVGSDFVSSYLWRGLNIGGLAAQPDVMLSYAGIELEAWANLGLWNNSFKDFSNTNKFNPELDLTLSYSYSLVKVGVTHQHYFDGSRFFDLKNYDYSAYKAEDYSGDQLEVFAEFDLAEVIEIVPLKIGWYTFVAGDDKYFITPDKQYISADDLANVTDDTGYDVKRAFSTYIEVSYDAALPFNLTLTPTIGITPWRSMYTNYEGKFAVNNISLKLNWEYEINDHICLDLYALGSLNTHGLTKDNLIPARADSYSYQQLNGVIGLGLWFF